MATFAQVMWISASMKRRRHGCWLLIEVTTDQQAALYQMWMVVRDDKISLIARRRRRSISEYQQIRAVFSPCAAAVAYAIGDLRRQMSMLPKEASLKYFSYHASNGSIAITVLLRDLGERVFVMLDDKGREFYRDGSEKEENQSLISAELKPLLLDCQARIRSVIPLQQKVELAG